MTGTPTSMAKWRRRTPPKWLRTDNDFARDPKFARAAELARVPLSYVVHVAFELNAIANVASPRGTVAEADDGLIHAATHVRTELVVRIRSALERAGYIKDDVILDFSARNPDACDPTAAERQQRRRSNIRDTRDQLRASATGPPDPSRVTPVTVTARNVTVKPSLSSEELRARASLLDDGLSNEERFEKFVEFAALRERIEPKQVRSFVKEWLEQCGGSFETLCAVFDNYARRHGLQWHSAVFHECKSIAALPLPLGPMPFDKDRR